MHGEGNYTVGDSYVYRNAMMVNNYPAGWPFHLRVNEDPTPTIVLGDEPTIITVDIVDSSEDAARVEADCGRLIRLRCGRRTDQPTSDSLPTPLYACLSLSLSDKKLTASSSLFSGFHVNLVDRKSEASASAAHLPSASVNEESSFFRLRGTDFNDLVYWHRCEWQERSSERFHVSRSRYGSSSVCGHHHRYFCHPICRFDISLHVCRLPASYTALNFARPTSTPSSLNHSLFAIDPEMPLDQVRFLLLNPPNLRRVAIERVTDFLISLLFNISSTSNLLDKSGGQAFVFLIDDITDPVPFNKPIETVYVHVQLSSTNSIQ